MLYKETVCPICNGRGSISYFDENSVSAETCRNCRNGLVVVPMTNGDLFRRCNNEQIIKVLNNLTKTAIYSGTTPNRLLGSSKEDFLFWLNKPADTIDVESIFDFINEKDFEHPWLKLA